MFNPKGKNSTKHLTDLFNQISNWGSYSGAVLSANKCKHLHICKKHDCSCLVKFSCVYLENVEILRFLGLTFNHRYHWETQNLVKNLQARIDVIKCLSSSKYNCIYSIVYASKALIVSKISFGLEIYGFSSKSALPKVKSFLNSTTRIAVGAHRTKNVNNLLFECVFFELNS